MGNTNNYTYNLESGGEEPDYIDGINYDTIIGSMLSIKNNQSSRILSNLVDENLGNLGVDEAKKLIRSGDIQVLVKNLTKFNGLDNDIANKLIQKGYIENLAKGLFSFQNLDKKIAKVLAKNRIGAIASNLTSFVNLDDEIAQMLIKNKYYYNAIAKNIDRFEKLSNETLLILLVNCGKHKRNLIFHKFIFPKGGAEDKKLLLKLKIEGKDIEYTKLKEFYDTILFEEKKEDFKLNNKFNKGFNLYDAIEALRYGEGGLIIKYIDRFTGNDYKKLIDLLLERNYLEDIKNILPKLWWMNLNRYKIVHELSLTNNYNTLINNADNFERKKISNIEIAEEIIENCDVDYLDCIKKLKDYSDEDEDWEWINYNLDFAKIVTTGQREKFYDLIEYFKLDFSPLSLNRKLPLKLKDFVKEKFGLNTVIEHKDLFK